jgi:formamidopyrimidine-DNA glycosylase
MDNGHRASAFRPTNPTHRTRCEPLDPVDRHRRVCTVRAVPELPEVESVRRQLAAITGRTIVAGSDSGAARFDGAGATRGTITAVRRRGKWLALDVEPPAHCLRNPPADELVIHLGMSGRLSLRDSASHDTHVHLILHLRDIDGTASVLELRDPRRFGAAVARSGSQPRLGIDSLGPEATDRDATAAALRRRARSTRMVKAVLLDQQVVAGVGNIYCDEALFVAGVHPTTRCCDLAEEDFGRLAHAVADILAAAVADGGTSFRDYRQLDNSRGRHQEQLSVYGRSGEPCPRCGTPLSSSPVAGRTTVWCGTCTPPP